MKDKYDVVIIGGSIAFWRDRTAGALIMISFTPVMLYRVIYSITYGTTLMKVLFPAILIACICHIVLRSIRQNKDENLYNAYCSFAVTISIFILILLFINLESSAKAINERNTIWRKENTLEYNMDQMIKFADFEKLSLDEKKDLVSLAAVIHRNYLRFPFKVEILYADLPEGVLGNFNQVSKTITLDLQHLKEDDGFAVYNTISHECYHCYQRSLLQAYLSVPSSLRQLHAFAYCDDYIAESFLSQKRYDLEYSHLSTEREAWLYGLNSEYELNDRITTYLEEQHLRR